MNHCQRCEDKDERIAWLESELGLQKHGTEVNALRRHLNVRPQTAQLVLGMYRAKGRIMTNIQLWETIPQVRNPKADDDRDFKMLDVQVCNARKAIGADAIQTVWGIGRALSPFGMERVASILGEAGFKEPLTGQSRGNPQGAP